ncbi:MAG: PQQ-dependent sugar dehydrogenase [Leeuwenhoekiella sp.]
MKKIIILLFVFSGLNFYAQQIDIESFATGFTKPLNIQNAGDDRLFIVEQGGLIKIVSSDGNVNETPFLDLSPLISTGGEKGLLGLAFHPSYQTNGIFFVNYTNIDGNTTIAKFNVSTENADIADASSETIILTQTQPYSNHNGGCIAFGPDGYLYIGLGDGGNAGDPENRAQNLNTFLGKLLRLDIDSNATYAIPSDNPFIDNPDARDEIWAYGLRNPWKFSFDNGTGNLWIADVGQNIYEEINKVLATASGLNYGWRCYEADNTFNNESTCPDINALTFPVANYSHDNDGVFKCSVTGGYVYRGSEFPNLTGKYIFADYCSGEIGLITADGSDNYAIQYSEPFSDNAFSSFGLDNAGEMYITGSVSGTVYKIIEKNLSVEAASLEKIKIYPNPAKSAIHIISSTEGGSILIYNILGKLIIDKKINQNEQEIDVSGLKSGLYMVKIASGKNKISTQKLIIN